jgi:putative transposase
MNLFRDDADRERYLELLNDLAGRCGLQFWSWCLMSNHVHFVAVPKEEDSLARVIGEAHRRYTRMINLREGVRGHLFQERFHSFPIQEDRYLLAVGRYVELNPVRAGMVRKAEAYAWSSARHHAEGAPDRLVRKSPFNEMVDHWKEFVGGGDEERELKEIRARVKTGRPWGAGKWVKGLEKKVGRMLEPRPVGRPRGKTGKSE